MSAFASLTLKNGALADVVFTPAEIANGVASYHTSDSIYDAKRRVTMSLTRPKNGGTVVRIKQRIVIPVMDAVDTSKRIGEGYVNLEFAIPKTMSETARLDLRKHAETLLANAITTAAVQGFENIY